MSDIYRVTYTRMWTGGSFGRLSAPQPGCARYLWLFLLTGPAMSALPGAVVGGKAALAEMLGWDEKPFMSAFRELEEELMAKADWPARLVWLPSAPAKNKPPNPNVVRGWGKGFRALPESDLLAEIYDAYRAKCMAMGGGYEAAFLDGFGQGPPPKGKRPRLQDQTAEAGKSPAKNPTKTGAKLADKSGAKLAGKSPDPNVKRVLEGVCDYYSATTGLPFPCHAQASSDIKALLSRMNPEAITESYGRFLLDPDPFYQDRAWGKFRNWLAKQRTGKKAVYVEAPRPLPPPGPKVERPRPSKAALEAWVKWHRAIKAAVSPSVYETWLQGLEPRALDGGVLVVEHPNPLSTEWIHKNLAIPLEGAEAASGVRVSLVPMRHVA